MYKYIHFGAHARGSPRTASKSESYDLDLTFWLNPSNLETQTKKMKYTIDAKNKKLGRLATEIAVILMGKNTPGFRRERVADAEVEIINASKMDIDEKKLTTKKYVRYTGYPGGIKTEAMDNLVTRKGYKDVLKTAVYGMLPKNKLRAKMIKNLNVVE